MADQVIKSLRDFPSVEELLQSEELSSAIALVPHEIAVEIARDAIAELKKRLKSQEKSIEFAELNDAVKSKTSAFGLGEIRQVINATGILVHTNLGRAPLGKTLINDITTCSSGYSNLEFNLNDGKRGSRGGIAEKYLALLADAESAAIVNNCAAALFIILNTFAVRKKVLLSRSELVQIGGGFRIPDILKRTGAKLEEVGTTNITNLKDYSEAVDSGATMILKVHKSNFVQSGFTKEVSLQKLAILAQKKKLLLVHDLGSGALMPSRKLLGFDEPTPRQSIRDGADIVCFSGDKMLGGVQSGLLVGKRELIEKIKHNPLFRTIRVDKIVIAALEKIFKSYLDGTFQSKIKLWELLSVTESDLYTRAKKICSSLGNPDYISVEATKCFIGGGGLPESALPSVGLIFSKKHKAATLMELFRNQTPPVIARIENDRLILDLKAVDSEELKMLEKSIRRVIDNLPK